ncbi:MAG: DUF5050 domain-containing protein [Blautia sp.]|nr:DUF5050 domain-containing protein [Blautia sp.]
MKKFLIITLCALIAIAAIAGGIWKYMDSRFQYNESYVNGNSAGNLYNGGLFCESSGTVFFANPDDNNRLYSMDLNGDNLKKLCDDKAMFINADSHYVYYVRRNKDLETTGPMAIFTFNNNSLCRISRTGGRVTVLDPDPCIYASLAGNYIYYLHYDSETATRLYKIGIDGKDKKEISSQYVFTCSTLGQYFYYNGMSTDGCLYEYDTATDRSRMIYDCNCYKPIVTSDNNVYYLDVNKNNALVHTNIQFGNPNTLTTDSIDLYNVYGSYIYYQRYSEDSSALCMVKNDGTDFREIRVGNYSNIHVTSYYIYFTDFRSGETFYTPTANPGEVYSFHPGVITED